MKLQENIPNPKDILLRVLTIINYQDDKNQFANDFLDLCLKKALVDMMESLPEGKKEEVKAKFSAQITPEEASQVMQTYFTPQQYMQNLQNATQFLFQDYLKTIMPSLSELQKTELQQYLTSLVPPEMLEQYKQQLAAQQQPQGSN